MVRWTRWHRPPDTRFEIRALAVPGRARYLSVTDASHNTEFYEWMEKKHFRFFRTAETGKRIPNSSLKGSGANHYPRAPALYFKQHVIVWMIIMIQFTCPLSGLYLSIADTWAPSFMHRSCTSICDKRACRASILNEVCMDVFSTMIRDVITGREEPWLSWYF